MAKMVALKHHDGNEETVLEWSLRHYELRRMGYKEVATKTDTLNFVVDLLSKQDENQINDIIIETDRESGERTILIKLFNQ